MSSFWEIFANRHVVLPVIHLETEAQALRNAEIARRAGCDGVFLINHEPASGPRIPAADLLKIHQTVCQAHPDWWVGVNCLDLSPAQACQAVSDQVAGLWVDNALIDERRADQPAAAAALAIRRQRAWPGLYFGGVAFKYQRPVADLAQAAHLAGPYIDVITTSGPATGQAAERDKIATMKRAIGRTPLAIASGISPDNVTAYLDLADCFLVATAISRDFSHLEPALVQRLVQTVRAY